MIAPGLFAEIVATVLLFNDLIWLGVAFAQPLQYLKVATITTLIIAATA